MLPPVNFNEIPSISTLTCNISGSLEVFPTLGWVVEIADCTDDFKDFGKGSGPDLSEVSFQLRERLFDGDQFLRVRREAEGPAAVVAQGLSCLLVPVDVYRISANLHYMCFSVWLEYGHQLVQVV